MDASNLIPVSLIENFTIEIELVHVPQCKCRKSQGVCSRAKKWFSQIQLPENYKALYVELEKIPSSIYKVQDMIDQIELDIPRTAPSSPYFSSERGQAALRRVLLLCAKYNLAVGYIQGINFIAASLLWHTGEIETFFLLLRLMDYDKLWENYVSGMPGVHKHIHILEYLVYENNRDLYMDMYSSGVPMDVLCNDWVITLFSNLAPLEQMHAVLELIFNEGWEGFYKLSLVILMRLHANRVSDNFYDTFMSIKCVQISSSGWKDFIRLLKKAEKEKLNWVVLCKEAKSKKINSDAIKCLNQNWRSELNI